MSDDKENNGAMTSDDVAGGAAAGVVATTAVSAGYGMSVLKDADYGKFIKDGTEKAKTHIERAGEKIAEFSTKHTIALEPAFEAFKAKLEPIMPKLNLSTGLSEDELAKVGAAFEQLQVDVKKTLTGGKTDDVMKTLLKEFTDTVKPELAKAYQPMEDAVRKVVGAAKYNHVASWWQKPIIAFESMTTKGKIGVGVVGLASALGMSWALNSRHSSPTDGTPSR